MELSNYVRAFRKSRLVLALLVFLGLAGGFAAYMLTPPTYSSSVTFYVSTPLQDGTNPQSVGQFAQARVNSYVSLLQSEDLARRVIADKKLNVAPDDLIKMIQASAELNTVLVTAEVRSPSAAQALDVTRGIADAFGPMVNGLDNVGRKAPIVVINVVSGPTLAPAPVSPSLRLDLGLGLLLGALLGALIAVLRELLDTTIRGAETATKLAKAPVLGTIGYDVAAKKQPLVAGQGASSARSEAFRQLRTNLQFVEVAKSADVVMVTSSVPREGKSLTAVNLALSFVELGHRVLLVEADLRRPSLSAYLDVEGAAGLTNVLVGQVEADDVIQPWGRDGLFVLPRGAEAPNPSELLGSAKMADLLTGLRSSYDEIILDTPPLLAVTDAVVCSGLVDGVLLVVRWGRTSRAQVADAVGALRTVHAQLLGVVLTMRKLPRAQRRRNTLGSYATASSLRGIAANG